MEAPGEYNLKFCNERHKNLDRRQEAMEQRLKKVENRFLVMITALIGNLVIGIILLGLQLIT